MQFSSNSTPENDFNQKTIMAYYRATAHRKILAHPNIESQQVNRSCGDRVKLQFLLDSNGCIQQAAYQGEGCSVCIASAAILCETVQGFSLEQAAGLAKNVAGMLENTNEAKANSFHKIIAAERGTSSPILSLWAVRNIGARVPCALLSWNILPSLLENPAF